ncbi:hypothetical protein DINM_023030 [Dirofilaria immitis]|nr:hypothetical protein [Dirofilaria immitis]
MCDKELDALSSARSRSELLVALQNVLQCISSLEKSLFTKYRILTQLVNIFHPSVLGLLTVNEFKELFTALFRSAPVEDALFVLINALHSCDSSQMFRLQHIIILLDDIEKTRLESLLVDSIEKDPNDRELCRLLGQTTCLMHNAFGNSHLSDSIKSDDSFLKAYLNNHWIYLLNSLKTALMSAVKKCQNAKNVNMGFLAGIIYELSRGDIVTFRTFITWLGSQVSDVIWNRISARLLTDTSNGIAHSENLLVLVLLATKDGEMLHVWFDEIIIEMMWTFRKNNGPWSTLHQDTICAAMNVWVNAIHVNHSSDEQLDYIDVVLLNFVKYANERIRRVVSSEVITKMTAGMNIRLNCTDIRRRLRGMFVSEVLTNWFSLGELKFEFPVEANEIMIDLKKIVDDEYNIDVKPDKNGIEEKKVIELETQNVRNDEENDEEYRCVEIPYYIRDCIELLNEQNDCAKFEAAFNALKPMIRRRAVGYEQSAEELLCRLIDLSDRFKIEHFQEKRLQLIESCLVTSPYLGNVAIDVMFSRKCSMMNRYIVLKALSDAASEYSSPAGIVENPAIEIPKNGGDVEGHVSLCDGDGKLISKTKLFVRAPITMLKENRFTPIANSFFYPLTAIDQHREHLDLIVRRDSELLSKILFCMAHLIKCSGTSPCTLRMCSTLAHLLIPLRHNTNFAVRQAYTTKLAEADPSIECRQIAQIAAETIAGIISVGE